MTTTDIIECPHTLVVHADGTLACDGVAHCHADELVHDWHIGCDELGCGCVGDEHDGTTWLLAA